MSVEETVSLMTSEDRFFIDLIEPELEEKISRASLEELLAAKSSSKSIYKLIYEPKKSWILMLDNSITEQVKAASFDDLLAQRRRYDKIVDELIEPILKNNVSAIIDEFAKSGSYDSAGSNSRLLVKIAEYLTPTQWENILEAFFQNDQLYCSFSCYKGFESLFKKSLEITNFVQPYWLTFRENLNKFNDNRGNSLKRLIDNPYSNITVSAD